MPESGRSLSKIRLFEGLPATDLDAIAAGCRWRAYNAGQHVIGHQDDTTDVFFVVNGQVRVTIYSASGKEVMFRDLQAGVGFGEMSAIDGQARSASVIALSQCMLAIMPGDTFNRIMRKHPDVAQRIMAHLTGLVRRLSDRVVEFSVLAVKNRIHAELLRLARDQGINGNVAIIAPAPTHAEIASRVCTHREAVTRELNALARDGFIERERRRLVIRDVRRLARLVEKVLEE